MFKIFNKKNNKQETKLYRIKKTLELGTGEIDTEEEIMNFHGMRNLVVNGFEILEYEEI